MAGEQIRNDPSARPSRAPRATPVRARRNTRDALVDAARSLFAELGTTTVSIDEICTRAGFTRGAFYSNFRTVDDVFFAVYDRTSAELLAVLDDQAGATPADGSPDAIADALLRIIPADPQWYALRAAFGMRVAADPERTAALHEHGEKLRERVSTWLEQIARATGRALQPDGEHAARVLIACHVGAVLQGPFVDDPEALRRDALRTALRGMLSDDADRATPERKK